MKKEMWSWSERHKAYALEEFDKTFQSDKGKFAGELNARHYKDAIVITSDGSVWLYTAKHFDALIKFLNSARRALLHGPTVKDEKDLAKRRARLKRKGRKP